jgi:transposase
MFIKEHHAKRVHIACGATDMRSHIDGLAAIVKYQFELDPFSCELFAFCNKERNKIKILVWDKNYRCQALKRKNVHCLVWKR